MAVLSKGTLFEPKLVNDLITKVKGRSTLAALSPREPIPFNGLKEFVFTMDSDVDIVAENGAKSHGGVTLSPVKIMPIKIEYGARVSDEFLYASEEQKINMLKSFNEGFSKKCARGLDLMAFHGINPRTKSASTVIGTNHFDSKIDQTVTYTPTDPESNIEAAIAMIKGSDAEITGIAMSSVFSSALAGIKVNGVKQYPELAWGANPGSINGQKVDVNTTISEGSKDRAIVGDFENMFQWGYAKEIPFEVIKYGDPDNSGNDLKGHNQVYLRAEMFIGWGIMDNDSFVRIIAE